MSKLDPKLVDPNSPFFPKLTPPYYREVINLIFTVKYPPAFSVAHVLGKVFDAHHLYLKQQHADSLQLFYGAGTDQISQYYIGASFPLLLVQMAFICLDESQGDSAVTVFLDTNPNKNDSIDTALKSLLPKAKLLVGTDPTCDELFYYLFTQKLNSAPFFSTGLTISHICLKNSLDNLKKASTIVT